MFRIKNVRNATVGKPPNILTPARNAPPPPPPHPPSQPPQNKPNPVVKQIAQTAVRPLPTRQLVRRNEGSKPKPVVVQAKGANLRPSGPIVRKAVEPQRVVKKASKEEEKPDKIPQPVTVENIPDSKGAQATAVQPIHKQPCQHINKHSRMIHPEPSPSQRHIPHPNYEPIQLTKQQESIKKEEEDRQARQRQERRLRKEREEEQERKNALKLQEMMEKVNARRKAREQEKERRMKFQQQVQRQRNEGGGVGGMVALSDPLAHVEMSQAVMDAQIKMVLGMKFAGYPNQAALQQQVQELQRINRSYLLVRADPNNPLIKGLANFRIQLFNRVGELIMQGQKQMGPSASGLRVIQADSRHYPQVKGVAVTRGMQGHLSMLRKRTLLQQEQCTICLGGVSSAERVYDVACGHIFHEQCLQEWLNSNANCPACRYNIKFGHPE